MKRRKRTQNVKTHQSLEARRLLAVTAEVLNGDLIVSGQADGEVEIIAVSESSFWVTDNGITIADESVLTDVNDDLRISMASDNSDSSLVVELGEAEIDGFFVRLGEGSNSLDISGGSIETFIIRGDSGDDVVTIASPIENGAYFRLGEGDDSVTIAGQIARTGIFGGDGNDSIIFEEGSVVDRVYMNLGEGNNSLTIAGEVAGDARIRTNEGDNTIEFSETSVITGNARVTTDDGVNQINVNGTIEGQFYVHASDGDDSLVFGETSTVDSIRGKLGDGENYVLVAGTVTEDVSLFSLNGDDLFEVADTASIGGESELAPGEQTETDHRRRHNRRGFGFQRGRRFGGFNRFSGFNRFGGRFNPTTPTNTDTTTTTTTDTDHSHDDSEGWDGAGQGSVELTYYIGNVPDGLSLSAVTSAIETALSAWSDVANITFTQTNTAGLDNSLDFSFVSLDGSGGTIAQAYLPGDVNSSSLAGDVQFDISESWEVGNAQGNSAYDLVYVAAHEIGHSLGLEHTSSASSVLYPYVTPSQSFEGLSQTDVNSVLEKYSARTVTV